MINYRIRRDTAFILPCKAHHNTVIIQVCFLWQYMFCPTCSGFTAVHAETDHPPAVPRNEFQIFSLIYFS